MLKNYLKIGIRNLLKNKLFTIINISGMAISIASFFIISLFVYDELQYDKHLSEGETKFRIYNEYFMEDGSERMIAMVPPRVAPAMQAEFPEVEYFVRFMNLNSNVLFEYGDKKLTEEKGGYVDPEIFRMFDLNLIEGDKEKVLRTNRTVAISKTLADKYFEGKKAIGETLVISDEEFTVDAVFEDFPSHSHLHLNYLLSMETLMKELPERMQSWHWSQFHTYVKIKPGTNAGQLEEKFRTFIEKTAWPVTKPRGSHYIPHLMPVHDIHLHASEQMWDIANRGSAQTVYILSATALFILFIAILNFINLSTARAVSRVKEVGVRKVVGAFRSQLIYQFISESIIIAFIALIIGGVAAELILPFLNDFTEKQIPADVFVNPLAILLIIIFTIAVGVAAGAYPAFYVSGYKPSQILANKHSGRSGKILLRKALVVLQFILSFFLIIASFVVSRQHSYMRNADMGFDKDNLIVVNLRGQMEQNLDATKTSFLNHENVIGATFGYGLPGEAYATDGIVDKATNKDWGISMLMADHDYIKILGLDLVAGRDFSKENAADEHHAFIISEAAAKMFGYTEPKEALGHALAWPRWDNPDSVKEGKVIGVIRDMHMTSMKENLTPVLIQVYPFGYSSLTLKVKSENLQETIAHLESTWKKFNPEWPFEYRFLDSNFDRLYKSEEKLATLFKFCTLFTIFVACLGLFGLVVYSTSQKYKEISIRKVLGAGEFSIVFGLGKTYLMLIAVAFVIAIPLSYYAANKWLEKFPYRIEVTPLLFIQAALLIFGIAILTVGIQSMKAARGNPVDALKEN